MGAGRPLIPKDFFSTREQEQITSCVRDAETRTSAEIRVRIESRCDGDPIQHCRSLLHKLGITGTAGRTGLLIYISLEDRKVAIFGDSAVDAIVGEQGWSSACDLLRERFHTGDFAGAICDTIRALTTVLAKKFPVAAANPNELPDEPSIGE